MTEFLWPLRVYYEDTDSGGVVYYANYLKFMERARTEWLRELGFEQDRLLQDEGLIFAVRAVDVEYLKPARFNDQLQISVRVRDIRRASVTFEQHVYRDGNELLCTGRVGVACVEAATMRPRRMPEMVLARMTERSGDFSCER